MGCRRFLGPYAKIEIPIKAQNPIGGLSLPFVVKDRPYLKRSKTEAIVEAPALTVPLRYHISMNIIANAALLLEVAACAV
jgi:hypothetical protein